MALQEQTSSDSKAGKRIARFIGRSLLILLETVLLLCITLYGVMYVLAKGPSPAASRLFVHSVRETSAIGFLADLFFTPEEIAIMDQKDHVEEYIPTDTSLISISAPPAGTEPVTDEWGLIDEDGDGIIIDPVKGESYSGLMMIVLDPSRVIVGCHPEDFSVRGYTVEEMVASFDGVAGTNASGFYDPDGKGNGSIPDSMIVFEGNTYNGGSTRNGFVGFDSNHIMHTGYMSWDDVLACDIQYGVSFGPPLIVNGVVNDGGLDTGGINPRTAVGQRSDGAVLLLVIDGRQVISLGASYKDLAEIMLDYGAVNACNLDGGSSTLMWYEDQYLNNCASVVGIRPVPTAIVVLKEGKN